MVDEVYYRRSRLTGRKYNIFDRNIVRILNMQQVAFYLTQDLVPLDVCVSEDKNGKNILVFLYYKDETKDAYDRWRNRDLED